MRRSAIDLAHRLGVVAGRLGLGVDVLDVIGDALFFFLEPLDALDEQAQLLGCDIGFAHVSIPRICVVVMDRAVW